MPFFPELSETLWCITTVYVLAVLTGWDWAPPCLSLRGKASESGGREKRGDRGGGQTLGSRMKEEHKVLGLLSSVSPPVSGIKKQCLFWGSVQTRQLWGKKKKKQLMAMINDNGLEESRDTAATYIIPSRQSLLLSAPLLPTSKAL